VKTIVPLTVAPTLLAFVWLLRGPATNDPNRSPGSTPGVITGVTEITEAPLPSSGPFKDSIPDIGKKTGPRSVKVGEWAIRKAADDEIARLKEPLKTLFQRWGLTERDLADALGLIHDKRVQTGLALNQRADEMADATAHEADRLYQQRQSTIATRHEAEMLSIIGSMQRLFEMTSLVTQVNLANNKANVPAMKAQSEQIKQWTADLVAEYKAAHGANYQQAIRERFGDAAAAAMLQQSGALSDD
jgi:hypothetical protein